MSSRALLLASLLVAPAVATAQTAAPGNVLFLNGRDFPMFVNGAECQNHASVKITWNPTALGGSLPAGVQYNLYASDQDPATNTAASTCFKTNGASPSTLHAGPVTATDLSGNNPPLQTTAFIDTTAFIGAASLSCLNSGTTVWICVEGSVGGTKVAYAASPVTIETTHPAAPTITSVTPGDSALNVSWDANSGTSTGAAQSYAYELTAVMVGTTTAVSDPSTHVSSRFTATNARFSGLVNTVIYSVTAVALSRADNASDPSNAVTGMPQHVNDFWDVYKNDGGRDDGGCAGGPAGTLALGLAAAALALARRRK
jgi:uncharacterized protein (TIGR03382 family)